MLCSCAPAEKAEEPHAAPLWSDMEPSESMELLYAEKFTADIYPDGYVLLTVDGDKKYLVVPEEVPVPEELDEDISVLKRPFDKIYMVSTAAMDYFRELDSIGNIRLSGTKASEWYIDEARTAMENGSISYAGKYSAPDYELIVSSGCNLAIENTMILHSPKVREELESFGVPVFIDYSSYESHPLARMEWIKLYSVILGKEAEAEKFFSELVNEIEPIMNSEKTDKTVAFFYITSTGTVSVRKATDYISKAIELSGGNYIFNDLDDGTATATMTIQMESFYDRAIDADILIYNSSIDAELHTMDELLQKSSLLSDFKAVKNGNVFCTGKNMFQESLGLGRLMKDVNTIVNNPSAGDGELNFLYRIK